MPAQDTLSPGSIIGKYEIVSLISAGGMGELYHARDPELGRDLVLKMLLRRGTVHPDALERFVLEARAASALNHPNIVTVYEIGESPYGHFIAMELIEGQTLRELRAQNPSISKVARIGSQAAQALAVAHSAGIIHRDIKPENLMLRDDGYLKVLDFGIAQLSRLEDAAADTRITQPGMVVGTMRYMSPEQATANPVTSASDIFSLGIVLYELATGRHPFDASSDMAVVSAIILREAIPPSSMNGRVPGALDTLLLRMLAKNPAERPDAEEVDQGLEAILTLQSGGRRIPAAVVQRGVIGRDRELRAMGEAFDVARAGRASMLCVSGEPGIGKTTLVEAFLRGINDTTAHFVAMGRCSERLAGSEAYLPLLDAIDDLLHDDSGKELSALLHSLAPTWASMLAGTQPGGDAGSEAHAQSQERLKRELAAFFEKAAANQPLVLLIEDIHWADVSTVDVLGYVLTRLRGCQLLAVTTYRPAELQLSSHPFLALKLDLQTRGAAREIPLTFLTEEYVGRFISDRFPRNEFPGAFTRLVHSRTEGSPLFVEDLLRYLKVRGAIVDKDGVWSIPESLPDVEHDIPQSMRSMVERKVGQLSPPERNLLAAASVQGYAFDSAIVARALDLDTAEVEDRLEVLDRVHGFVRRAGEREFPGGEISGRYRFVHVLYQNSLYASLSVSRRIALSKAVGEALLELSGGEAGGAAAELGFLFETAREFERAAGYFAAATAASLAVFAFDEAGKLAKRALALLKRLPSTPQTAGLELRLQLMLGSAAGVAGGYAAPDAKTAMARARALAEEMGSTPALSPALWGLHAYYLVSGEIRNAMHISLQAFDIAVRSGADMSLMTAHTQMGITKRFAGEYAEAVEHFTKAAELYDPGRQHEYTAAYHMDPGVFSYAETTRTLWAVGRIDDALAMNERAMELARTAPDPRTVAFALLMSAVLLHLMRRPSDVLRDSAEGIAITDEHGIVQERAWLATAHGWANTQLGEVNAGTDEMAASLAMRRRMNAMIDFPYALSQLSEGYLLQGNIAKARATLDESVSLCERNDDRWYEAEVHRLIGDAALLENNPTGAEAHYRRSLDVALGQGTKSFELRTSVSLARLLRAGGKQEEALQLLSPIRDWFRRQQPTRDYDEACDLIAGLENAGETLSVS